jgi:hypothetical protein
MFWKRWDLSKFVSTAPINNIVMRMDDARLFRFNRSRDVSPFLLRQIIKDIRLTREEFMREL